MPHRHMQRSRPLETITAAVTVVCIVVVILAIVYSNPTPTVQFSYSETNETGHPVCHNVIPESAGDCDHLPIKFNHQWVK